MIDKDYFDFSDRGTWVTVVAFIFWGVVFILLFSLSAGFDGVEGLSNGASYIWWICIAFNFLYTLWENKGKKGGSASDVLGTVMLVALGPFSIVTVGTRILVVNALSRRDKRRDKAHHRR